MRTEYINRVELQGRVGTIRRQIIHSQMICNFSLQIEHLLKDSHGPDVCEVTWLQVCAFESDKVSTLGMSKGSLVHLVGRLRANRYTSADGVDRIFTEVIADSLEVLEC